MRFSEQRIATLVIFYFIIPLLIVVFIAKPLYFFITFLMHFWYVSIPLFLISLITLRVFYRKRDYKKMYLSRDNKANQKDFESKTGKSAINDEKLSKPYISWLMKGIPKKFYKTEDNSFNDVFAVIIALIIILLAFFMILALNSGVSLI